MNQMSALAAIVAVSLAMFGAASMSGAQQAGSNDGGEITADAVGRVARARDHADLAGCRLGRKVFEEPWILVHLRSRCEPKGAHLLTDRARRLEDPCRRPALCSSA